jgi:hypothetical protein
MELLIIIGLITFLIFGVQMQKWYDSYLRELKKRKDYEEYYVMNLREYEMKWMEQDFFIGTIKFLFLLSLFTKFLFVGVKDFLSFLQNAVLSVFEEKKYVEKIIQKEIKGFKQ